MALVRAEAMFKLYPAEVSYKQKVKLRPNEHHYENEGEKPCIKYTCQLCEQLSEKANKFMEDKLVPFSFPEGTENCPCCGVNIDWSYKGEIQPTSNEKEED